MNSKALFVIGLLTFFLISTPFCKADSLDELRQHIVANEKALVSVKYEVEEKETNIFYKEPRLKKYSFIVKDSLVCREELSYSRKIFKEIWTERFVSVYDGKTETAVVIDRDEFLEERVRQVNKAVKSPFLPGLNSPLAGCYTIDGKWLSEILEQAREITVQNDAANVIEITVVTKDNFNLSLNFSKDEGWLCTKALVKYASGNTQKSYEVQKTLNIDDVWLPVQTHILVEDRKSDPGKRIAESWIKATPSQVNKVADEQLALPEFPEGVRVLDTDTMKDYVWSKGKMVPKKPVTKKSG